MLGGIGTSNPTSMSHRHFRFTAGEFRDETTHKKQPYEQMFYSPDQDSRLPDDLT